MQNSVQVCLWHVDLSWVLFWVSFLLLFLLLFLLVHFLLHLKSELMVVILDVQGLEIAPGGGGGGCGGRGSDGNGRTLGGWGQRRGSRVFASFLLRGDVGGIFQSVFGVVDFHFD